MQKGQALLVVLLVMGVVVTVGLSVVSRSVTDINISTTEDQAAKALQAAEAGVEQALAGITNTSGTVGTGNNASFNFTKSNLGGGSSYVVPYQLDAGDVTTVNLTGYTGTNVVVCWGRTNAANNLGLEAMLYYMKGTSWTVGRNGYNQSALNVFETAISDGSCSQDGVNYKFQATLNLNGSPLSDSAIPSQYKYLRLRLFNNANQQPMVIKAPVGYSLPNQGNKVVAVGTSGDTAQKIIASDPMPDLPFMFDAALFSGGQILQ